jgi:hypothetical protein
VAKNRLDNMRLPWRAGRVLEAKECEEYCQQVISDCCYSSIRPAEFRQSLLDFPLLLKPGEWPRLARLAEDLAGEVTAAEQELFDRPDLYESLGLRASILKVLKGCRPKDRPRGFARVMRFDFYFTTEGWMFSEANPDTAGGYVEAYGPAKALAAYFPGFFPPPNPAAAYADSIGRFGGKSANVAIFHSGCRVARWTPEFILNELEKRGIGGVLVNPRHLRWESNRAVVSTGSRSLRPDLVIRHLLADWLPNLRAKELWAPWFCGSRTPISNPGYSILVESKSFPVVLKELDTRLTKFCRYSPESRVPSKVPKSSESEWVFKPTFGFGGHGIGMPGVTRNGVFKRMVEEARRNPLRWVAQRRFESVPVPTERGPGHVCLGLYTVDGSAAGIFARIAGKPLIDGNAPSIAVLIPEGDLARPARGGVPR